METKDISTAIDIGTAVLHYSEGKLISVKFESKILPILTDDLISQLESCNKKEKAEILISTWFDRVSSIELTDMSEYKLDYEYTSDSDKKNDRIEKIKYKLIKI